MLTTQTDYSAFLATGQVYALHHANKPRRRDKVHIHLIGEAILMSTHNIGFYEEISKIIS